MIYQKLSKRQRLAMLWWAHPKFKDREILICDGSIRSGKTLCMTVGFALWSMSQFNGQVFGICGKTIESLRRNVIMNMRDWLPHDIRIIEKRSENKLIISDGAGRENTYFLFGGRDESSYALIQGITLAGLLMDEVVLMPKSFVEQAMARCSVSGSKIWFNCNPSGPEHWFYKEIVLRAKEMNALHIHFTMDDNNALDPAIKARYERGYSGVFYDRYIRGLWVVAEGLVYPMFGQENITDKIPERGDYYISCDYGTLNPFSAGLWIVTSKEAVRIREYYYSGRDEKASKTDEEYYTELEKLAGDLSVECVIVDPSAASFIETIRRHGRFSVRKARNEVVDGIVTTARYIKSRQIKIHKDCNDAIREFGLYRWDDKCQDDRPIKENDHAMDDIRYMAQTVLRNILAEYDYRPILPL